MLHFRNNIFFLKETSSKFLHASKNGFASFISEAEKWKENSEFGDESDYQYKERRGPRKNFGSSYQPNSRYNQRFEHGERNNRQFRTKFQNPISRERYGTPSEEMQKPLLPIEKFFYVEHPDVTNRSEEEVQDYRNRMNITLSGTNMPKPVTKFSELCLPENLTRALDAEKYAEPTPIQAQGFPIALSGQDMIGISQTGSGKTLAYMLPAIVHAVNQSHKTEREECKPQVLVLGPTRELVQQIHEVSKKFIKSCGLSGAIVYGGASKDFQLSSLAGAEICIATPGRLIDFISGREVSLRNCSYLVLDEADRMLDMGFEPQIRDIVETIRPDRQTLMWSATWPSEIRNLAHEFLSDFAHITIGSGELLANPNIEQKFYVVESEDEKEDRLISLLEDLVLEGKNKVLVFAQTKRKVDYLTNFLSLNRIHTLGIHGDISQFRRDKILNSFRKERSSVLIATDVASRGLDITDIRHVVNFDFPTNIEDYIHRIGRTARGTSTGVSHSFFGRENAGLLKQLFAVLKKSDQEINPDLYSLAERKTSYPKYKNMKFNRRSYR